MACKPCSHAITIIQARLHCKPARQPTSQPTKRSAPLQTARQANGHIHPQIRTTAIPAASTRYQFILNLASISVWKSGVSLRSSPTSPNRVNTRPLPPLNYRSSPLLPKSLIAHTSVHILPRYLRISTGQNLRMQTRTASQSLRSPLAFSSNLHFHPSTDRFCNAECAAERLHFPVVLRLLPSC